MGYSSSREAYETLINAYYGRRDLSATLSCVTEDIGWIGTEDNEFAFGKEELKEMLGQSISRYPDSLNIDFDVPRKIKLGEDAVTLMFQGKHTAEQDKMAGFTVRGTIGCIRTGQGWLVNSVHASVPNYVLEKQMLEQQLEETRRQEHMILSCIPGGAAIYRMKKDGRFFTEYVSDGLAKLCGYDDTTKFYEYLKDNPLVNVPENEIPLILEAAERSLKNHESVSVMYHLRVQGKPNILNRLDANLMDVDLAEDDVAVWYAIHTIVSEEALQIIKEQKQFQNLINQVPAGIGIYEVSNGQLTQDYINDAFYQMLGTTREDRSRYFGNNTMKAVHPDDVSSLQNCIEKLVAGASVAEATYRVSVGADKWFWLHVTASVVERREHYTRMYVAMSDYNETMQNQSELEYRRATMKIALSAAKVLTWRYDYKKNQITDSMTLGEAFQLPKVVDDVAETVINMGFIADESKSVFRNMFKLISTEQLVSLDLKATVDSERGYAWYRMIYTPVFDAEGSYVDAIGIAIDITEQKEREVRYEEQLRLSRKAAEGALSYASYNLTENVITQYDSLNPDIYKVSVHEKADKALADFQRFVIDVRETENIPLLRDTHAMINAYKSGVSHIAVRHRIKGLAGWMETTFDMIANPQTGDVEAIGFMRDITDVVRSELVVNQLLEIDYQSIFLVNTQTGVTFPFQRSRKESEDSVLQEIAKRQEALGDVQEGLNSFLREYAVPGTADNAVKENEQNYIREKLETAPFYETTYSLNWQGKKRSYRIVYAYLEQSWDFILCAIQDITEIYEKEEQQRIKLSQALEEAQAANEAKTAFLSRVSHDIRTPLNGILGMTTLLKKSCTDEHIGRDLNELEMSGKYLLNLINDTLDMSKIESGKLELHPQVCEGKRVFHNALGLAKVGIQAKKIELHVQADDIPFTILYVDVERIEQVVLNVLGNAVKFTPEGGRIDVIMTNLSVKDGVITDKIEIRDNGIGISKEFLPYIFEAFSQEDATRTSSYQGTGLGMAITRQLVQLMGGDITVESEQGKGTQFTIIMKLPIATSAQIAEWKKDQTR